MRRELVLKVIWINTRAHERVRSHVPKAHKSQGCSYVYQERQASICSATAPLQHAGLGTRAHQSTAARPCWDEMCALAHMPPLLYASLLASIQPYLAAAAGTPIPGMVESPHTYRPGTGVFGPGHPPPPDAEIPGP